MATTMRSSSTRSIGREHLAVLESHYRGRARVIQTSGEDPCTGGLEFLVDGVDLAHNRFEDLRWGLANSLGCYHAEKVMFHGASLLDVVAGSAPTSHLLYE